MQAIILAAGMGKRLKEYTRDNTKCMVEVNGVTLIERMLHQLDDRGLSRIVLVVGYQRDKLKDFISNIEVNTPIVFVDNPIYDKTNNIYSLSLASEYLSKEDTLLFESDLIFEDSVLDALVNDERDTIALVDKYESWMDGTCLKISEGGRIEAFVPGNEFKYSERNSYYKTVNIYKFSQNFSKNIYVPFLEAYEKALGENEYYEQVLRVITMVDNPTIEAKALSGELWYEIDDVQDLDIASSMFVEDDRRVELISSRYGGYWRYPKVVDFCYLVNPYFPPQKMIDEIQASFSTLMTQYPSGMRVNSLLAAKNFDLHPENIVIGNGAAELIKILMDRLDGKVGIIRPTFEEYANRLSDNCKVVYNVAGVDYKYTAKDIMDYYSNEENNIDNLIIINPDNPSGNCLSENEVNELIGWTKQHDVKLIIDESFIDFSEKEYSVLRQDILDDNSHLFVIKSISKSYGVPGLRLGILASGNIELISQIKKSVSIWNINSFAEFYMQIYEKYKKDYKEAMDRFKNERRRMFSLLDELPGIRVNPSESNYFMIEITAKISAKELTKRMLIKHNLFIKDLSTKIVDTCEQYVRIAIRNENDNDKLVSALKEELLLITKQEEDI